MLKFRLSAFADELSPDIDRQIEWLRSRGLDLLEIRGVDGQSVADITPGKAREVRDKLDRAGIGISAVGSPIGKIGIEEDFAVHIGAFRRLLDLCEILGAKRMRIFSFFIPEGADPAGFRPEVMRRLGKLAKLASDRGITLCHENEKSIYGDTPERCADIYNEFGGEIKSVFDHANYISCGAEPFPYAFGLVGRGLSHMHIKDANGHAEMVPAGEGIGRIPETLDALRGIYDGEFILTLEPHLMQFSGLQGLEKEGHTSNLGNRYASPEAAFDRALEALKRYL